MKKHMLRVLSMAIALTMSMTFALSGCGSDTGSSTSGEGTTSSTEESTGTEEALPPRRPAIPRQHRPPITRMLSSTTASPLPGIA